jgi:pyruvate dehydrogenase E2 component (dihydrolipoamide acetyltransferase)
VTEFKLPELGENIETGDVVRVLVRAGDSVQQEQPILELETDKATIEVPSSVSGVIKDIRVKPGDKVKVGQAILVVDEGEGAGAKAEPKPEAKAEAKPEAKPEAKAEAKPEAKPEARAEAKPEAKPAPKVPQKAAQPSPQPDAVAEGGLEQDVRTRRPGDEGATRGAQEREAGIGEAESAAQPRPGRVVDISAGRAAAPPAAPVPAAPSTRRFAREMGVDVAEVPGSGPGGRISLDDVKSHVRRVITGTAGRPGVVPLPDFSRWGEVERQPMRAIRRKTAERMAAAWSTVPHVTQCDKADITELEQLRQKYAKRVEAAGGKLTVTAIALKVAAAALRVFPEFNVAIDVANEEVILKKYVHIGVAVDTDAGLLVPVIRDVDRKNLTELSVELSEVAAKAKARKLTLEEMEGGCFTITNLGGIGGTYFTPIVNAPEVAILGISRSATEPVFVNGKFEPRLMMPLSLSYDHRVIDGATAIRWLRWVCDAFEQPFVMSL